MNELTFAEFELSSVIMATIQLEVYSWNSPLKLLPVFSWGLGIFGTDLDPLN